MVAPSTMNSSATVYRYRVDADDRIISVDDWWLAFARENGAPQLTREAVVGCCLWDFIAGEPTQVLYQELHQYVRRTGTPVTVPFRCDSPRLQRFMELTIHREPSSCLLYESELKRALPQPRVRLLDRGEPRSDAFLTMCSFCKRTLLEPSGWLELKDVSLKLRLFAQQAVPEIRYTVCPRCALQCQPEYAAVSTPSNSH